MISIEIIVNLYFEYEGIVEIKISLFERMSNLSPFSQDLNLIVNLYFEHEGTAEMKNVFILKECYICLHLVSN